MPEIPHRVRWINIRQVQLEKRHPLLPEDFDPRFWQCAHPDLIATPHLKGDEQSAGWHVAPLDGVHFDFREGRNLVMLTWRTRFALSEPHRAVLTLKRIRLADATMPISEAAE